MKFFKIIYNSFLWAMVIAITCFKSEWLQMRVNTGYIFFIALIFFAFTLSLIYRKREFRINAIFTMCNLAICAIYSTIIYGFDRLKIVPAALLREGIHQTSIPFHKINIALLTITIVGIFIILICDIIRNKKVK